MTKRALLIGIGAYLDPKIEKLVVTERDAICVRDALFNIGFSQANVNLLLTKNATCDAVRLAVRDILASAQEEDEIVVYLSGHGMALGGLNYFLCYDSPSTGVLEKNPKALSMGLLLDLLINCLAKKVLLCLDCCHSGLNLSLLKGVKADVSQFSEEEFRNRLGEQQYKLALCSCGEREVSYEDEKGGNSVWTHHFLEAIKGDVPEVMERGCVNFLKLQDYLARKVPETVKRVHGTQKEQNPSFFGGLGNHVYIFDLSEWLIQKAKLKLERVSERLFTYRGYASVHVDRLEDYIAGNGDVVHEFFTVDRLIRSSANSEVKEVQANIYKACQKLNYKVRELVPGDGSITTPEFSVDIWAEQDPVNEIEAHIVVQVVVDSSTLRSKDAVSDIVHVHCDVVHLDFSKRLKLRPVAIFLEDLFYITKVELNLEGSELRFGCEELKIAAILYESHMLVSSACLSLPDMMDAARDLVKRLIRDGFDLIDPPLGFLRVGKR